MKSLNLSPGRGPYWLTPLPLGLPSSQLVPIGPVGLKLTYTQTFFSANQCWEPPPCNICRRHFQCWLLKVRDHRTTHRFSKTLPVSCSVSGLSLYHVSFIWPSTMHTQRFCALIVDWLIVVSASWQWLPILWLIQHRFISSVILPADSHQTCNTSYKYCGS